MKVRAIRTALFFTVLLNLQIHVYAGDVFLNGFASGVKIAEKNVDGTIFVPLRKACDFISAKLAWDDKTKTITVYNPGLKNENPLARLSIGKKDVLLYDTKGEEKKVACDDAPVIIDSYTYVPLYYIESAFGIKTRYEAKTGAIYLETVSD